MECPVCGSANVTPSHRRGAEKLFRYLIPRAPYRCKDCWSRFRRFENPWKTPASKAGAFLGILLLAGIIVLPFLTGTPPSEAPPSSPPPETEGDTVASLPVPQHRARQRSFDEPVETPASAPPSSDAEGPVSAPEPIEPVAPLEPAPSPPAPADNGADGTSPPAPSPSAELPAPAEEGGAASTEPLPPTEAPEEAPASARDGGAQRPDSPVPDAPPAVAPAGETGSALPASPAESETASPAVAAVPQPAESAPSPATDHAEALPPVPKGPRTLREITPRSMEAEFEMTVDAAGPVRAHKIFYLADPPKLVVDLPGKWEREVSSPVAVSGELVRRVRIGAHPDFVRLVLDLAVDGPVGHDAVPTATGFRLRVFPEGGS